jgi:hypothetical protein
MKTYLIKETDIMHNGKISPEGSTIELDEKEALQLSNFLVTLSEVEVLTHKKKSLELEPKLEHNKRSK